jgi:hypothetical protein
MDATYQRRNQGGRLLGGGLLLLMTMACSGRDLTTARNAVLPTSPSGGGFPLPSSFGPHLSTDALRPFPDRQLAFQFRSVNLEQLYRTQLARGVFPTNVNPEGSVIWVSEYLRYRVSGCSAADSFSRILTQISGGGVPPPCSNNEQPFPDRADALSFRRQLETVYRNELRAPLADTHVDDEGDVIWTMEYLRYVLSGCSQDSTIQKITQQINGGGVPADCASSTPPPPPPPPPPSSVVADFSVTPNDLSVAKAGQCVTESVATPTQHNVLRCTFDGRISTPAASIVSYEWNFLSGSATASGPTVQNLSVPCGSVGGAGLTERTVTLTVRTSDGRSNANPKTVQFVKPSFC